MRHPIFFVKGLSPTDIKSELVAVLEEFSLSLATQ